MNDQIDVAMAEEADKPTEKKPETNVEFVQKPEQVNGKKVEEVN